MTMAMSIAHRVTGIGLYIGVLLLAWFLIAASTRRREPSAFFPASFSSFIGQLLLFGFTWALFHHLVGGLRHFVWDARATRLDAPLRDQIAWGSADR